MLKYLFLFLLFVNSNTYASKKVICQISFNVPEEMDKRFDSLPLDLLFQEIINYDESVDKRIIQRNIVGEIQDTFSKKKDFIENDKIFSVNEKYYIIDSNGASISVRESSCLNYSKKIEMEMNDYLKAKDLKKNMKIAKKDVKEVKTKVIKKEKIEPKKEVVPQNDKIKKQPISDKEKDLIKKALELAL